MFESILAISVGAIVGIVVGSIALFVALFFVVILLLFKGLFGRQAFQPDDYMGNFIDKIAFGKDAKGIVTFANGFIKTLRDSYPEEAVSVQSKDGLKLIGRTYVPIHKNGTASEKIFGENVTALCLHGYSSRGPRDVSAIAMMYLDMGVNVVMPDHRGHGESEGKWIGFGVLDSEDILKWIDFILAKNPNEKIVIHGISMGAATAMQSLRFKLKNVVAVVADCGFTSVYDEISHVCKKVLHIPAAPVVNLMDAYCKKLAGYDFSSVNSAEIMAKNKDIPCLFIHGTGDSFVPSYMSEKCYAACGAKKDIMLVTGACHGGSGFKEYDNYREKVKEFVGTCV